MAGEGRIEKFLFGQNLGVNGHASGNYQQQRKRP
jgi:hypothetical protein